jgi:hypothetical protein
MFKAGRYGLFAALVCIGMACSSNKAQEPSAGAAATQGEGEPAATGQQGAEPGAEQATPAEPAKPATEETMKTMDLPKLATSAPLQLDVPEGVEIDNATENFVKLAGGGLELLIEIPAEGILTLEDERGLLAKPGVDKLVDETLPDGEALGYRVNGEIHAIVARPKLGVLCSGAAMKTEQDARRVVEMCKTLRAASK